MMSHNRVDDVSRGMASDQQRSRGSQSEVSVASSDKWKRHLSTASSEGERMMLEALVEASHGGRRVILQYITMLSVIALPVAAVIGLVSFTLHHSPFLYCLIKVHPKNSYILSMVIS